MVIKNTWLLIFCLVNIHSYLSANTRIWVCYDKKNRLCNCYLRKLGAWETVIKRIYCCYVCFTIFFKKDWSWYPRNPVIGCDYEEELWFIWCKWLLWISSLSLHAICLISDINKSAWGKTLSKNRIGKIIEINIDAFRQEAEQEQNRQIHWNLCKCFETKRWTRSESAKILNSIQVRWEQMPKTWISATLLKSNESNN